MAYNNVLIEDARIIFRHFSGEKDGFHAIGQRDFSVVLPADVAENMEKDGWNIKWLPPREEGDEPTATLKVKVNFSGRPPHIELITSQNRTKLTEEVIGILDYADIEKADMFISPYDWEFNGKTGRSAYLSKMFVTIREDELDRKYAHIPIANEDVIDAEIIDDEAFDRLELGR